MTQYDDDLAREPDYIPLDLRSSDPRDTGYAPTRWTFDAEVTRVFDNMLDRSIPQYETMREAVTSIADAFLPSPGYVLDLGCSTGETIARIRKRRTFAYCLGLEISEPMAEHARARFENDDLVSIIETDLRDGLTDLLGFQPNVVLSILTLMFVPINYRQKLLEDVYAALPAGGSLILVEKVLGDGNRLDEIQTALYHEKKRQSGYTNDDIERKRLALEGVLVPVTNAWNVDLLYRTGFARVDTFWAWMNFRGLVAVK